MNARFLAVGLVLALCLGACGGDEVRQSARSSDGTGSSSATQLEPLRVLVEPIPDLGIIYYDTKGTFPQLRSDDVDVAPANQALADAIFKDQETIGPPGQILEEHLIYRGYYETYADPSTVVANTGLVSTMYKSLALRPGGNHGTGWISTTILMPSVRPVELADLFPKGTKWLNALATETEAELCRMDSCVSRTKDDELLYRFFKEGLAPRRENYQHFALSSDSLDIGLGHGQLGSGSWGAMRVSIPWERIRPHMSAHGRHLADLAATDGLAAHCSAKRLWEAVVAKEGVDTNHPGYRGLVKDGDDPGVRFPNCMGGWAMATVSRPLGAGKKADTLFRAQGPVWREVARLSEGRDLVDGCVRISRLIDLGVPRAIAQRMGCPDDWMNPRTPQLDPILELDTLAPYRGCNLSIPIRNCVRP